MSNIRLQHKFYWMVTNSPVFYVRTAHAHIQTQRTAVAAAVSKRVWMCSMHKVQIYFLLFATAVTILFSISYSVTENAVCVPPSLT